MTETWMTSIDLMLTKDLNRWHIDSNLCTRTVIFYEHVSHWNCAYWNFKPHFMEYYMYHGFLSQINHKKQLIFPEMVGSNSFYDNQVMHILKTKLWYKKYKISKMASSKKCAEIGTPWSKTYKLYNKLQLVFTILVYMVSEDSLKVFFVSKFRLFHIYVSQNSM